jgi:hypothetical protein
MRRFFWQLFQSLYGRREGHSAYVAQLLFGPLQTISFELNVVDIGVNQYGKTITTCVMQEQEVSAAEDFDDLPELTDREQILMDVLEANEDPDNNLEMKKLRPLLKSHLGFFQGQSHRAFCNAVMTTVTKLVTNGKIKFDKKKQLVTRCVTAVTDDVTVH